MSIEKALQIEGWMFPEELEWLAARAADGRYALEIGSYCGRSARAVADHIGTALVCIDPWTGGPKRKRAHKKFRANLADLLEAGRVIPHRGYSHELFGDIQRQYGPIFDLVFIDGDHSYEACQLDIELYGQLVRPGGILAGHDYHHEKHPGVAQAVDELGEPFNLVRTIWWIQR